MSNILINPSIREAQQHLDAAWEEMARPEEDVVVYMVCKHALNSVKCYLNGFLLSAGVLRNNSDPVEHLIDECRKVDIRFQDLDLTPFVILNDPDDVYMNLDVANDFLELCAKTRDMVTGVKAG